MKKYMLLGAVAALVLTVGAGQARAARDCGREVCEVLYDVVGIASAFEANPELEKRLLINWPEEMYLEERLMDGGHHPMILISPGILHK